MCGSRLIQCCGKKSKFKYLSSCLLNGGKVVGKVEGVDFNENITGFVKEWTTISIKYREKEQNYSVMLAHFLGSWQKLPTLESVPRRTLPVLSYDALNTFVSGFVPAIKKLQETGVLANVWEVAGLKHNEVRISSVLNWFLSPNATHGQGSQICKKLFEYIEKEFQGMPDFPKSEDVYRYRATVEVCPNGERDNRVDIVLNGESFLLYIEVKIDAKQGDDQLKRYHQLAKDCSGHRRWGVVYLTPKGVLPADAKDLDNCISVNWGVVANALKQVERKLDQGHLSKHYIGQFSEYISKF